MVITVRSSYSGVTPQPVCMAMGARLYSSMDIYSSAMEKKSLGLSDFCPWAQDIDRCYPLKPGLSRLTTYARRRPCAPDRIGEKIGMDYSFTVAPGRMAAEQCRGWARHALLKSDIVFIIVVWASPCSGRNLSSGAQSARTRGSGLRSTRCARGAVPLFPHSGGTSPP
jgi:hypothetical protein